MYSASSTESRCSFAARSTSEIREYERLIMRTPVLMTLCRSLRPAARLPLPPAGQGLARRRATAGGTVDGPHDQRERLVGHELGAVRDHDLLELADVADAHAWRGAHVAARAGGRQARRARARARAPRPAYSA